MCTEHKPSEAKPVEPRGVDSISTVTITVEGQKGAMTVTERANTGDRCATDVAENTAETIDVQPWIVIAEAVERKDITRNHQNAHRNTA